MTSNFLPHYVIALSYFAQGKLAEAREPAEEAFRRAPWHAEAVGLLAGLLARAGEKERAEKLIATLRGMIPLGMFMYHLVCWRSMPRSIGMNARLNSASRSPCFGSLPDFQTPARQSPLAQAGENDESAGHGLTTHPSGPVQTFYWQKLFPRFCPDGRGYSSPTFSAALGSAPTREFEIVGDG